MSFSKNPLLGHLPSWKSLNRHISTTLMNLVHKCRFGTWWQSCNKIWKFSKFNMADRHTENRFFLAITQQPIGQFQWKFAWGSRFSQNFSSVSTEHISCFPNVVLASVRGGLFISSKIHLFKNIFVNVKCWPNSPVFTVSINNRNWHVYIHDTSQLTCLHTAMTCHNWHVYSHNMSHDMSTAMTCDMSHDMSTAMTCHNWHVYRHDISQLTCLQTWHVTCHVYRRNMSQLTCLQT